MPGAGRATAAMTKLYNDLKKIPSGVGSGMIAAKSGFHSSRAYNKAYHSGDYSIRGSYNDGGPSDAGAAIDISMSSAQMKIVTKRFIAAMDRKDPRVSALKEFIGTTDGRNVVRYTRETPTSKPERASSDSSHLWHGHWSLFRDFVDDYDKIKGIADVALGKPATESENGVALPKLNDKNEDVKYWQGVLTQLGYKLTEDGTFGPKMQAALTKWHGDYLKRHGSKAKAYNGKLVTGSVARELHKEFFAKAFGLTVK